MDLLNSYGGGDITHILYNSSYFIVVSKNQLEVLPYVPGQISSTCVYCHVLATFSERHL